MPKSLIRVGENFLFSIMKKLILICLIICFGLVNNIQAQKKSVKNSRKRNIQIVNNELIEYQKDGLINWTKGYLQGIGKESVKIPEYENIAMTLAVRNLVALYSNIQIIDTIKLSVFAEKTTFCRQVFMTMKTNTRGQSISPTEIKNDTCIVNASIDFETLLNFQYQDTTLKEWIFANYIKPIETENKEINKLKSENILPYEELNKQIDSLAKNQNLNTKIVDSIALIVTSEEGKVLSADELNLSILSSKKIYVRLNGKLYDRNSKMDINNLVPLKYQPLVNLGLSEIQKKIDSNTDLPKFLKAVKQEDGSLLVDFDKLIEKKEKANKIFGFVKRAIITLIPLF